MRARYVFAVRFRLEPTADVRVEPSTFETRLLRPADPPGEDGWLFFRDNLWRGDLGDEAGFRDLASDALGVPVVGADFRALETDEASLDALRETVSENLEEFRADSVTAVLSKYLGSAIEVRRDDG